MGLPVGSSGWACHLAPVIAHLPRGARQRVVAPDASRSSALFPHHPLLMPQSTLEAVSAARWRVAISLTVAMMAVYFGFVLLVAFNKPLLGVLIARGLSLGMLLGALVILVAWALTWAYVRWANTHYDTSLERLRGHR